MTAPTIRLAASDRPTDLRLAHVHLRMGSLELARAELESFAGRGTLDAQALLDLAEVRWRTGDLPGAGVAASAYLGTDDQEVLALVIAAEAAAAVGHPGDARRLAQEALELLEVAAGDDEGPAGEPALDALFAGMPQSQVWPIRPHFRVEPTGMLYVTPLQGGRRGAGSIPEPVAPPIVPAGGESAPDGSFVPDVRGDAPGSEAAAVGALVQVPMEPETAPLWAEPPEPADAAAAHPSELADARSALEAGDPAVAAARLGDLLRRRPDLAGHVLDALAERPPAPDDDPPPPTEQEPP